MTQKYSIDVLVHTHYIREPLLTTKSTRPSQDGGHYAGALVCKWLCIALQLTMWHAECCARFSTKGEPVAMEKVQAASKST